MDDFEKWFENAMLHDKKISNEILKLRELWLEDNSSLSPEMVDFLKKHNCHNSKSDNGCPSGSLKCKKAFCLKLSLIEKFIEMSIVK